MFVLMGSEYLRGTIMWIKSIKMLNNDAKVSKRLFKELGINKTAVIMWGIEYPVFLITTIIAFTYLINH
jgi:hypothetical protein